MGRFRQGKIIGLAVAVCLIVICGVLLWRAKPHKTEETLVISHALKEDKGSIQHIKNRLRRTDRLRQRCRQQRRQQHHRVDMQKLRHMTK